MLLCPWDFLVKNTGVGYDFLSQGISPRIEPKSPVWQADSLPLSHQGSPPSSSQQMSTKSLLGNAADSGAVTVVKRQNVCPSGAEILLEKLKIKPMICNKMYIRNKISVLIHAKEKSEAELEEGQADSIINIEQYLLICYKFYMH